MKKNDPQSQLVSLVGRLRNTSQNLFSFTTSEPEFITRDKGLYAFLLAKPSKRLASTLAVDRELLILCSPFEDQQQRTIKTAREVIESYEGRLENGIAIIVHNDRDGNAKLQKWGRTAGIAVLPLYAGRMPSNGEELEHYLCHELFSHDPFDVTGPVSDDENFFGRRNEALDLARKLQVGQIRSCSGICQGRSKSFPLRRREREPLQCFRESYLLSLGAAGAEPCDVRRAARLGRRGSRLQRTTVG